MGEDNFSSLVKYATDHFNEVVLDFFEVCRCVGYYIGDDDYYLILKHGNGGSRATGQRYICSSWVGEPILLKGKIDDKSYNYLDRVMALNGNEPEAELLLEHPSYKSDDGKKMPEFYDSSDD